MLARVTLENFFSFGEATTIKLNSGINVLVGINGSGKSNFLKAIRLLRESIVGDGFEKVFLKDWSGFNAVANFNEKPKDYIRLSFEFDKDAIYKIVRFNDYEIRDNPIFEITINRSGASSYYLKERLFTRNIDNEEIPLIFLGKENFKNGKKIKKESHIAWIGHFLQDKINGNGIYKSTELLIRQISDPENFYLLFILKRAVEEIAFYDYFDTTLSSGIRQPASFSTEKRLLTDGQNLMSTLMKIKNEYSLAYEKIEEYIKKINPNFKDINSALLGSRLFLVLREKNLSRSVSIEHISDGTLRYLILLSILFNPERGNLVCIDEPEIGLHPDMINSIANAIKSASKNDTQMIVATHSPLLLNAFDIDEVLIFDKDATNQTKITIKSEEDFGDWNENYVVGQLWLSGLIGGKRW